MYVTQAHLAAAHAAHLADEELFGGPTAEGHADAALELL